MSDFSPAKIVHVDLAEGLPDLDRERDGRDLYLVFWWRGVPLGLAELGREQTTNRANLAHLAAQRVAGAVGDRVLPGGLAGVDPELPRPEEPPAASLDALLSVPRPLSMLDEPDGAAPGGAQLSVSVVVCTRDRPATLARCLESLERCTVPADEIVVVDNAPASPSTREVVERFPQVRYVAEPRPSLSVARNTGIASTNGDVVAFTDDDTIVHPDWVWRLRDELAEPRVMAVTGLVLPAALDARAQVLFEKSLGGFGRGFQRMTYGTEFFEATRDRAVPVWKIGAGANMAVRRRAFELVGDFDERLGAGAAGCSEDSELWYRLLAEGWECRYQPAAVAFHEHRSDEASLQRQAHDYLRGHVAALFVQFARYGHRGNLHRALLAMPAFLLRQGLGEGVKRALATLGVASHRRRETYGAEVAGYVHGLRLLPLALSGPRARHKAPLRAFLARNPFPYPFTEGFFYREKMRAIHAVAPDRPVRDVLEVGGGRSGLTALLYPAAMVTNVDLEPEHAESPMNRAPRMRFVQGDATSLPFADRSFDAVTMFDLLEHVPDDDAAAREALRVVRPGGFVLVSSPNEHWRFPYHAALGPICPPEEEMFAAWGHVRRGYTLAELEHLFGRRPAATATFINSLTSLCHDVSFSRLPGRARRAICVALAPVTWTGYWLHSAWSPGTETASCWLAGDR